MMPSIPQILIMLFTLALFIVPIVLIIKSKQVAGIEKVLWVILAIFFSVLAYIAFLIYVRIRKAPEQQ